MSWNNIRLCLRSLVTGTTPLSDPKDLPSVHETQPGPDPDHGQEPDQPDRLRNMQVPKAISDLAPQGYTERDQTKGDVRFWAPSVRDAGEALEEAQGEQAAVLDRELAAVRGVCVVARQARYETRSESRSLCSTVMRPQQRCRKRVADCLFAAPLS